MLVNNNRISNIKKTFSSNLLSNTITYRTGVDPIRTILMLPVLVAMYFVMYGFAILIGDEKAIRGFEMMFELLSIFGIAVLLLFAGIGIFVGLVMVIHPMYLRINKIVKTPQQVESLRKKIETITDNKQQSNKILNLLYQVKDHINEDPPDAKIHNLENKCEEQKWEIEELKRENKKKDKQIEKIESRLDEFEKEKKGNMKTIMDKAHANNNQENTKEMNNYNRDEILD